MRGVQEVPDITLNLIRVTELYARYGPDPKIFLCFKAQLENKENTMVGAAVKI